MASTWTHTGWDGIEDGAELSFISKAKNTAQWSIENVRAQLIHF